MYMGIGAKGRVLVMSLGRFSTNLNAFYAITFMFVVLLR